MSLVCSSLEQGLVKTFASGRKGIGRQMLELLPLVPPLSLCIMCPAAEIDSYVWCSLCVPTPDCDCYAGGTKGNACRKDPQVGMCVCKPNFQGAHCDQCSPGHYGPSCQRECLGISSSKLALLPPCLGGACLSLTSTHTGILQPHFQVLSSHDFCWYFPPSPDLPASAQPGGLWRNSLWI